MEDPYWQSFMEQAVRLIYFLAESPDQLCSRLLQRSARLLLDQIAEGGDVNKDASQVEDGSQEPGESGEQGMSPLSCHLLLLNKFSFISSLLLISVFITFILFPQ